MIFGVTGNPLTAKTDGKTTVAQFLVDELDAAYIDLTAPVRAAADALAIGIEPMSDTEYRSFLNDICASGRKQDVNYWLHLALQSIPRQNSNRNLVFDNVFFYNEYLFIKSSQGFVFQVSRGPLGEELEFVPDVVIRNTGSLDDLHKLTIQHLSSFRKMA